MEKTQFKELINIIKETRVSFIAVALFVALGVAVYTGIGWSGESFLASINKEYQEYNFHDFEASYPFGFSDADIAQISSVKDVDEVVGIYTSFQFFDNNGIKQQAKVVMITDKIDSLSQIEGKIPTQDNEIVVEKNWANLNGLKVGDTITFEKDGTEDSYYLNMLFNRQYDDLIDADSPEMRYLNNRKYTITALAESANYMSTYSVAYGPSSVKSTPVDCIMFVNESAFNSKAFNGYNGVVASSDKLKKYAFYSDRYKSVSNMIKTRIENALDLISESRNEDLDEIRIECIDHFDSKIRTAERKIRNAESKIKQAESKLTQAKKEYKDLEKKINEYKTIITNPELVQGATVPPYDEQTLTDMQVKIKQGSKELSRMKAELKNARDEISQSRQDRDELKTELDKIEKPHYRVNSRSENGSAASAVVVADFFPELKLNMASLFVIIGLLVCYSAISRLVHKQSKLIGTKKALGLTNWEITRTYLIYAGCAAIVGAFIGLLTGRFIIEPYFLKTLQNNYMIESSVYYGSVLEGIVLIAVEVTCAIIAAYIASHRLLKTKAIKLLNGEESTKSKERFFEKTWLWKKTSLFQKTIINNFFNDSRRVFAMIVGAAGCTALVVCGILYMNTICGSFDRQYEKIQNFDTIISYDEDTENAQKEIAELLDGEGIKYTQAHYSMGGIEREDGEMVATYLLSFSDECDDFLKLYSMNGDSHKLENKMWISCAYPDNHDLHEGDQIDYVGIDAKTTELTIGGIYEFYLQRPQLVMSDAVYEEQFGKKPETNAFILNRNNVKLEELETKLADIDGYVFTNDFYARSKMSFDAVGMVSKTVASLFVFLSLIMALLIQLNLLIMFVEEKKKEIITLRINGYSIKQAKKYIYTDTIILTILGILIGVVVGILMGLYNVNAMTSDESYFMQDIDVIACICGVASTTIFTTVMSVISLSRIRNYDLSELGRA